MPTKNTTKMTKRKADAEAECPLLVKSLRRSITEFVSQNEAANIHSDRTNTELLDYGGESWEQYRKRLDTFDVKSRISKPKEVSPVECARHGWKNIGDDFIQCDDCASVLYVKMPNEDVSIRVFKHCIWRIQRKLVEAHTVICPWRTNGGLSTSNPYDIAGRYKLLMESGQPEVPMRKDVVEEKTLELFGVDNNPFFLQMAIFGWLPAERIDKDGTNYICNLCGRKLNTCIFSEQLPLDPLEMHHSYCPVVDKVFPLWQESLQNVHKLKKKEPLMPTMWNVKSMLKRIFGGADEEETRIVVDELGEEVREDETETTAQQSGLERKSI